MPLVNMPFTRTVSLRDDTDTARLGARLAAAAAPGDVIALSGDLGAGKTTLARGFVRALTALDEEVPSPTFTLVQTYDAARFPIWHFDLYRIGEPAEVVELGWDEALAGGVSLVEWPERLGPNLPAGALQVRLVPQDMGAVEGRRAEISGPDLPWRARLDDL
ncbi:MAG: tRNA (adenosine(37)-N6)-threonylcarbamoyltransferase complex ATPase subunit type 1 TsaE [Alphaproteobacteria bacterium]